PSTCRSRSLHRVAPGRARRRPTALGRIARAMPPMNRRTFLITGGLALAGIATACGKKGGGGLPARATMDALVNQVRGTTAQIPGAGNWNILVVGKPTEASKEVWGGAAYPAVQHVRGPGPGGKAIAVATPTVADHRGVEPYCTDTPPCSMHAISLDRALASGRP